MKSTKVNPLQCYIHALTILVSLTQLKVVKKILKLLFGSDDKTVSMLLKKANAAKLYIMVIESQTNTAVKRSYTTVMSFVCCVSICIVSVLSKLLESKRYSDRYFDGNDATLISEMVNQFQKCALTVLDCEMDATLEHNNSEVGEQDANRFMSVRLQKSEPLIYNQAPHSYNYYPIPGYEQGMFLKSDKTTRLSELQLFNKITLLLTANSSLVLASNNGTYSLNLDLNNIPYDEAFKLIGIQIGDRHFLLDITSNHKHNQELHEHSVARTMSLVTADVFDDAMRTCHVQEFKLTYSYVYPTNCRMFIGIPVYENGAIDRKDRRNRQNM